MVDFPSTEPVLYYLCIKVDSDIHKLEIVCISENGL